MIKKTTKITETDNRGRVVKRIRIVEVTESNTDRGYDYGTRYGTRPAPRDVQFGRIMDAYNDYRMSEEW